MGRAKKTRTPVRVRTDGRHRPTARARQTPIPPTLTAHTLVLEGFLRVYCSVPAGATLLTYIPPGTRPPSIRPERMVVWTKLLLVPHTTFVNFKKTWQKWFRVEDFPHRLRPSTGAGRAGCDAFLAALHDWNTFLVSDHVEPKWVGGEVGFGIFAKCQLKHAVKDLESLRGTLTTLSARKDQSWFFARHRFSRVDLPRSVRGDAQRIVRAICSGPLSLLNFACNDCANVQSNATDEDAPESQKRWNDWRNARAIRPINKGDQLLVTYAEDYDEHPCVVCKRTLAQRVGTKGASWERAKEVKRNKTEESWVARKAAARTAQKDAYTARRSAARAAARRAR